MPAPVAPVPRAADPTSIPASGAREPIDPPDQEPDPDTDRLRLLLSGHDPWRQRLGDQLAAAWAGIARGRVLAVVAAAVALGAGAYVVLGAGRGSAVDPVQVLPKVGEAAEPATPIGGPGAAEGAAATTVVASTPGTAPPRILVHAAGAVSLPGVHEVPVDARVADLIDAAGGLAPDADPDRINLAAPLRDGERIYVPRRGEAAAPDVVAGGPDPGGGSEAGGSEPSSPTPAARVDLNHADAAELDALPGVGPATAAAIIGHRSEHGPFSSVDELQDVAGIGPAKLAQLRDLVRV